MDGRSCGVAAGVVVACLQGEFGLLLLQLGPLPLDHNAQQLVLQPLWGDHEVQQRHLHHTQCTSLAVEEDWTC